MQPGAHQGNLLPWCVVNTAAGREYAAAHPIGDPPEPLPVCPANLGTPMSDEAQDLWALRGAMNAGLSVFMYLDLVTRDSKRVVPPYDRCDLMPPP